MKKAAQTHRSGSKGSGGIKTTKCLSLRENADSTKPESAPPATRHAECGGPPPCTTGVYDPACAGYSGCVAYGTEGCIPYPPSYPSGGYGGGGSGYGGGGGGTASGTPPAGQPPLAGGGPGYWSLGCPFPYNSTGLCGLAPDLWTGQIGASVSFNLPLWGLTGTYYVGLAFDLRGNIAAYYGAGGGHGVGASAEAGVQVGDSNAYTVCGLRGPFTQVSSTAGAEAGGTIDVFEGSGNGPGGVVRGGTVTLGPTEGASASILGTATGVVPFRGHCGQGGLQ